MNVLFIFSIKDAFSPIKPLLSQSEMQFGISYISSCLKLHGHQTKLLILTKKTEVEIIDNALAEFSPSLICFTAVFSEYEFISNIANYIKSHYPEIFLLAGGPHISLNPEDCISDSFDAINIGEGEEATVELSAQLEKNILPSQIPNLWIKNKNNGIEKNPPRAFLQDLDDLPLPDRAMWQEWIENTATFYPVLLGRGCPFPCTYCCNHALRKVAPGKYVRLRSVDNILDEIREITIKSPHIKEFYLEIETFGVNTNWAVDLCSKLETFNAHQPQPLSFGVNLRVTNNMDIGNLFLAMKRSNFKFINIGLESGSERVRGEILKRNYSNEKMVKAVKLAKQHGLKVTFQILIGIPGETLDDFKETISVTRICQPDFYCLNIYFPYPGTELYRSAKEKGLLNERLGTESERTRAVLDLPGFTKKQIVSNYVWFESNVYKGYKPLYEILDRVITAKLKSTPLMFHVFSKLLENHLVMNLKNNLKKVIYKRLDKF